MRSKNELYQAAMRAVALRRQTARALAEDRRAEAEAAIPALRHAEDEVRVRGIRCALAGAAGQDKAAAAAALPRPARTWPTCWPPAAGAPTPWNPNTPAPSARTPGWPRAAPASVSAGRCAGCAGRRSKPFPA